MQKLRQEAEVMKDHAWLARFRKGNVSMSGQAGKDIANYVDRLLEKVIVGCTDRTIVCLCGSTRFMEAWQKANLEETLAGRIVLSVGCNTKSDADLQRMGELSAEKKIELDELHKRKIDLADEILILNCLVQVCPKCETIWNKDSLGGRSTLTVLTCSCGCDLSEVPHRGYIGASTRSELEYARDRGKWIRFLNPEAA